jgi:hypothetical protein
LTIVKLPLRSGVHPIQFPALKKNPLLHEEHVKGNPAEHVAHPTVPPLFPSEQGMQTVELALRK